MKLREFFVKLSFLGVKLVFRVEGEAKMSPMNKKRKIYVIGVGMTKVSNAP